jgi:hypothetical protein
MKVSTKYIAVGNKRTKHDACLSAAREQAESEENVRRNFVIGNLVII